MKQKKCHYCKNSLQENDDVVKITTGKKRIVEKDVHRKCFNERQFKDKFYEKLFNCLDIKPVKDKNFYIITQTMKKSYSWEIMFDAVTKKELDIAKNKYKPMPYILKIISNQLIFSERDIKQQEKIIEKQNQLQEQIKPVINITQQIEYKQQQNKYDISDLLE